MMLFLEFIKLNDPRIGLAGPGGESRLAIDAIGGDSAFIYAARDCLCGEQACSLATGAAALF
ncbi:hypothetical protein [Pseudomonas sp. G166]|uniref:hypothetical protein n=1 Tax=Pseudomonas sp. G166 TaxID=3094846 RepID=UPI00300894E3